MALLKTYLSVLNMDIVCLCETHLDASVSNDDNNLQIPDYSFFRKTRWSSHILQKLSTFKINWRQIFI